MQLSFMSWLLFFQQLPWRVRFGQLASLCNKWNHPAGRSHVSRPGSREASSQFSGCQGPQGKVPPRKRTHNPVNHTGRTGWFCSTFLIAHILLFLSDWKKKILSSIWKILKCEAQCLRQITHRDERGQNSADGITGFASRYASLQTALSWSFAPGSRLWVGWPKSHHSKWDKILGKKEVDKEPAGTNQGFPRRTSLSVQTGKDVTCLGVIAEANRKCVIKSQTWSASWPTAPLRKWFHQHLTLEISYFPACSSLRLLPLPSHQLEGTPQALTSFDSYALFSRQKPLFLML